jgi:hypothetical protein
VCCIAPLLFGIAIYVLFAVSQSLSQIVFGYDVSLQGLIKLEFPLAPPQGWLVTDRFGRVRTWHYRKTRSSIEKFSGLV